MIKGAAEGSDGIFQADSSRHTSAPRVKVCGITSQRDLCLAVDLGADAIGLNFYPPSPRALEVRQAVALATRCPAFTTVVALFVNPTFGDVAAVVDAVPQIGVLQFHGTESPEFCEQFKRPYIKSIGMRPGLEVLGEIQRYPGAAAILLDSFDPLRWGGTGRAFDWGQVPPEQLTPTVLAGGLNADNVAAAVRQIRPYAVDVCGGVEASPGVKDEAKMKAFMWSVESVRSS